MAQPSLLEASANPPPVRTFKSASRQKVALPSLPIFMGAGKRPEATPAHQVLLLTGMSGGIGGLDFLSPMIWRRRSKDSICSDIVMLLDTLIGSHAGKKNATRDDFVAQVAFSYRMPKAVLAFVGQNSIKFRNQYKRSLTAA